MARWDENDDLFPDTDGEDNGEAELNSEYIKTLESKNLIEAAKLELIQKDLNYSTLIETLNYLEKSIFWRFKSKRKKLDLIIETYQTFKALVDIESMQEEEEEEE